MRELPVVDMSNLPTPIMRPSSFDHSMEEELQHDNFLPLSQDDEAISRFLAEQSNLNVSNDGIINHTFIENDTSQDDISEIANNPQRVTPSQTNVSNAHEKRRASDTTSSSMKPPEPKKTRGLECHVKNLSLIFEALSAS